MSRWLKAFLLTLLIVFAVIGLAFTVIFAGMRFGAFNVRGAIDSRNAFFWQAASDTPAATADLAQMQEAQACVEKGKESCAWTETPEWAVVKAGLAKDESVIGRAAGAAGVDPRLVAAAVVPEQLRFFASNREVFKRYFEPLKILGSLTQFSLGVSGIKQETAARIEQYAADPASSFYPGPGYAELVAYPDGADHDKALYARLTDDKNHYYSYLYTALYLKEIQSQWQRAGFAIGGNPEAQVTLFNIGFDASHPNASPRAAGAAITVGGMTYPFGTLGGLFYRSEELTDVFPKR